MCRRILAQETFGAEDDILAPCAQGRDFQDDHR
jgi:hypothetical protein